MTLPVTAPSTILLVDDSPPLLEALQYLLQDEHDLQVVGVAETGQGGIELAAELKPDLVLLDIQLPDMLGYDVSRALKALPFPPVVILISAHGDQASVERTIAAGSDAFIEKSNDWTGIVQKIRRTLAARS